VHRKSLLWKVVDGHDIACFHGLSYFSPLNFISTKSPPLSCFVKNTRATAESAAGNLFGHINEYFLMKFAEMPQEWDEF
jgi:hypothetical protein